MLALLKSLTRMHDAVTPPRNRNRTALLSHDPRSLYDCSHEAVMRRIADAFDSLEQGRINPVTFEKVVRAELVAVQDIPAAVAIVHADCSEVAENFSVYEVDIDDRDKSIAVIEHCLQWIADYRTLGPDASGQTGPEAVNPAASVF
jgi:hypothetical protein